MPKKVLISACLLGEFCRYDGKTKKDTLLLEKLKDYTLVPFCPEAPSLGTPRERISVVKDKEVFKLLVDNTKKDVTNLIINETKKQPLDTIAFAILKSKSPSCGDGTTPIYDKNKEFLYYGDGLACAYLKSHNIKIYDENSFLTNN